MSGHSKWHNIQGRKNAQDAKRGKIFQKIAHDLYVAAKSGGVDPDSNPSLRLVLEKAKSANMSKDIIKRNLDKVSGKGSAKFEEVTYEGYGPGGVAVLVETSTDNINRTVSTVRSAFTHHGGSMGTSGSVSFQFDRKGLIVIDNTDGNLEEDAIFEDALEAGAEDVSFEEGVVEIKTSPSEFQNVEKKLSEKGYVFLDSAISMIPQNPIVDISESDNEKLNKLLDELEESEDILAVYTTKE